MLRINNTYSGKYIKEELFKRDSFFIATHILYSSLIRKYFSKNNCLSEDKNYYIIKYNNCHYKLLRESKPHLI